MTTVWTNTPKLEGAPSITYNQAITYNNVNYNYNGQIIPVWTNETKN